MAQATILASGITEATSTDIAVAAGEAVTVGLFTAAGSGLYQVPPFQVLQATPGGYNIIDSLDANKHATVLAGPGTYRVRRSAYDGTPAGVFTEN